MKATDGMDEGSARSYSCVTKTMLSLSVVEGQDVGVRFDPVARSVFALSMSMSIPEMQSALHLVGSTPMKTRC